MAWNPIDWAAGPFLTLYIFLAVIVFIIGFTWRMELGPAGGAAFDLSVFELAYLAGGASRVGDAALLCLTAGKGATIAPKGHKIDISDQRPLLALTGRSMALPVKPNMTRQQFQTSVKPLVERAQSRLQEIGCCPTDRQMDNFRLTILPFVGLLVALGAIKAMVGSERGHAVGFLVVLVFITGILGLFMAQRPTRTKAGNSVLDSYKARNARASRAPLDNELLLAVALSGAVVLSGTAYSEVYAASQTMSSSGDGGGGSGCGGGGGGGCGGCS